MNSTEPTYILRRAPLPAILSSEKKKGKKKKERKVQRFSIARVFDPHPGDTRAHPTLNLSIFPANEAAAFDYGHI